MANEKYTPTVDWARRMYAFGAVSDGGAVEVSEVEVSKRAEFDRMIAQVERVAAAKALRDFADRKFGTVGPHRINMDAMYDVEMSLREEADRIESGGTA